jgi:toxin ParE1/3/4
VSRFTVEWTITARDDLDVIASYIAEDSVADALAMVERIEARAATLVTQPTRGRLVPELRWHGVTKFQELIERPWRIVYRVEAKRVVVVGVLDGRRSLDDLLLDRLVR